MKTEQEIQDKIDVLNILKYAQNVDTKQAEAFILGLEWALDNEE